jgi:hypothetical protein
MHGRSWGGQLLNPDFRDILSEFSEEKVEYLLVGAYALAVYGLPRATGDIDLWIRRSDENSIRVERALEKFGAPTRFGEKELLAPDTVIQIGVAPRRIDILTSIDGVDFDEAWRDRTETEVGGLKIFVIGRQHLIQNKKAVGRPQDLADAARLAEK